MLDTTSYFPNEIDNRVYFQDCDITHWDLKQEYDSLISHGRYDDARLLYEASDLHIFGADIMNLLENRLVTIGTFLPTIEKPELTAYQSSAPSGKVKNFSWIA